MRVGLLPLYITLYDIVDKSFRNRFEPFYEKVALMLESRGVEVVKNDFCMEEEDFKKAVNSFEENGCDAIVTLHIAYSPSLKSSECLKKTNLPIIICDTTETFDFSDKQSSGEIMYCHGIHGVMDMCNLLKKHKKPYAIAAGHIENSDVIDRVVGLVRAAKSAKKLYNSKVGSIGSYFDGMGDFRLDDSRLKDMFGVEVVYPCKGELYELVKRVTSDEIQAEKERNLNDFEFFGDFDDDTYNNSIIADLALKKWIEKKKLQAFTINFRNLGELPTMPFNGICRAMSEQVGYAGEGDTLTALFTGALLQGYKYTSFIEIFCPDWKNNTVFISHMGEMNYNTADKKPEFFEKDFIYGDSTNPIVGTAAYKPGKAVFMNIYEDDEGLKAFISPVDVLKETTNNFQMNIRGWLKFPKPLVDVLEKISEYGVTHHSILIYDTTAEEMTFFAKCLGLIPVKL